MILRPRDTSSEAWRTQSDALVRLGGSGRVAVAVELSEAVREIQIEGLRARHPGSSRAEAVRELVERLYGIRLPSRR